MQWITGAGDSFFLHMAKGPYNKRVLLYANQLELLKGRGLEIADEKELLSFKWLLVSIAIR